MRVQETGPLVLLMFTVLCALPAAAAVGLIPSAFAQEEEDDDTNTQVAVPLTDQDQGAANLGANLAANVDTEEIIEEARSAAPTPSEEEPLGEEPPEFVAFCHEFIRVQEFVTVDTLCYETLEDCIIGGVFFAERFDGESSECEGVETFPPGAGECQVFRDEEGEPVGADCDFPQ